MPVNFPSNPSNGDTHSEKGKGWQFDATAGVWRSLINVDKIFDTDDIIEGTTNLFSTDERIDDRVNDLFVAGANITLTYNDVANTLTIASNAAAGYDLSANTTSDLAEGTNLYYTDARVQTKLGTVSGHILPDTDVTYDLGSATNRFRDLYLSGATIDLGGASISYDNINDIFNFTSPLSGTASVNLSANDTGDLAEGTNLYYTDARVQTKLGTVSGHILPDTDVTYDLGSPTFQWRDIYVGPGSLYVNNKKVVEDDSGTITVRTDVDQNLRVNTSGTGQTTIDSAAGINVTTTGSADVTVTTDTGQFEINANVTINSSKSINSSDANPITFGDAIDLNSNSITGVSTLTTSSDVTIGGNLIVNGTTTTVNTETINLADNIITLNSNQTGTPSENAGIEVERGTSTNTVLRYNETTDAWEFTNNGTNYFLIATDTDDLTEGTTNLYYTTARANTDFDNRFATKSTTNLTEGTNLYYTDERVDDRVSQLLVAGTNITLNYDDAANTLTITALEDDLSNNSVSDLADVDTTTTTPTNGDALVWNGTNWVPQAPFSQSDFDTAFASKSVDDLNDVDTTSVAPVSGDALVWNGTNFVPQAPFSQSDFDTAFASKTTTDLTEGTNLYYTTVRANNDFDTRLATKSTTNLAEGTNLYYTDARVDARLASGSVGNIITTGYIAGPATFTIDPAAVGDNTGTVVIAGNLQVDGTTTTINSTIVTVDDLNITLASGSINAAAANGAGITVDGANATITYDGTNDTWDFNKNVDIGNVGFGFGGIFRPLSIRSDTQGIALHFSENNETESYAMGVNADGSLVFYNSDTATTPFTIADSNFIGIGTTTPSEPLHVYYTGTNTYSGGIALFQYYDTDDAVLRYEAKLGSNGDTFFKSYVTGAQPDFLIVDQDNAAGRLAFQVQGNAGTIEGLAVESTGRVGMGTTAPTEKLDVNGAIKARQPFFTNSQTVTADHTIAVGESAMAAGPVTVNSGVTVTISSGSRWVIL